MRSDNNVLHLKNCLEIDDDRHLHEMDDRNIARAIYLWAYNNDGTRKKVWLDGWKREHLNRYSSGR